MAASFARPPQTKTFKVPVRQQKFNFFKYGFLLQKSVVCRLLYEYSTSSPRHSLYGTSKKTLTGGSTPHPTSRNAVQQPRL